MSDLPTSPRLDAEDIADVLIRIGRLAYARGGEPALTPTQWTALRFFSRANRYSRTVSAFADFQATTRGTVSQTVKTLTEKGYLRRTRSESDARSVRLDLTARGREAIRRDPVSALADLVRDLPRASEDGIARFLTELVEAMAEAVDCARFGRCELCRFLCFARRESGGDPVPRCRMLNTDLEPAELGALCASYAPMQTR